MAKKRGYITPESTPTNEVCFRVYCPDDDISIANLRGALDVLACEYNHDDVFGNVSEAEIALIWTQLNAKTFAQMVSCEGPTMFTGQIIWLARNSAPDGTLLCDGGSYDALEYPELFLEIGYNFGGSDGNFNVPDLRRRSPYGVGDNDTVGDTEGEETHTQSVNEMPAHTHPILAAVEQRALTSNRPGLVWTGAPQLQTASAGGGQAFNVIHPVMLLLPCIVTGK